MVLWSTVKGVLVSLTGLLPSMVGLSKPLQLQVNLLATVSATPIEEPLSVWALPISLAATKGIEFSFSSSGYLDVSVPLVCLQLPMDSVEDTWTLLQVGFPIRKSLDQSLLAAPQCLSQLTASFIGSWCQGIHPLPLLA